MGGFYGYFSLLQRPSRLIVGEQRRRRRLVRDGLDLWNLGTWLYLWGAERGASGTAIDVYIPQQHMGVSGLDSVTHGEYIKGKRRN